MNGTETPATDTVNPFAPGYRLGDTEQINGIEQIHALIARALAGENITLTNLRGLPITFDAPEPETGEVYAETPRGRVRIDGEDAARGARAMNLIVWHCPMTVEH